jgi:hypothetical protein
MIGINSLPKRYLSAKTKKELQNELIVNFKGKIDKRSSTYQKTTQKNSVKQETRILKQKYQDYRRNRDYQRDISESPSRSNRVLDVAIMSPIEFAFLNSNFGGQLTPRVGVVRNIATVGRSQDRIG